MTKTLGITVYQINIKLMSYDHTRNDSLTGLIFWTDVAKLYDIQHLN